MDDENHTSGVDVAMTSPPSTPSRPYRNGKDTCSFVWHFDIHDESHHDSGLRDGRVTPSTMTASDSGSTTAAAVDDTGSVFPDQIVARTPSSPEELSNLDDASKQSFASHGRVSISMVVQEKAVDIPSASRQSPQVGAGQRDTKAVLDESHDDYSDDASREESVASGSSDEEEEDDDDDDDDDDETLIDLELTESKLINAEGRAARQRCLVLLGDEVTVHKKTPSRITSISARRAEAANKKTPHAATEANGNRDTSYQKIIVAPIVTEDCAPCSRTPRDKDDSVLQDNCIDFLSASILVTSSPRMAYETSLLVDGTPVQNEPIAEGYSTARGALAILRSTEWKCLQNYIKKHGHRVNQGTEKHRREMEKEEKRVLWIQRATQGVLARRIAIQERKHALMIQRVWRGTMVRDKLSEGKASTTIQRFWRGTWTRLNLFQKEKDSLVDQEVSPTAKTRKRSSRGEGRSAWERLLVLWLLFQVWDLLRGELISKSLDRTGPHSFVGQHLSGGPSLSRNQSDRAKKNGTRGTTLTLMAYPRQCNRGDLCVSTSAGAKAAPSASIKSTKQTCAHNSSPSSSSFNCQDWGFDFGFEMKYADIAKDVGGVSYVAGGLNRTIPTVPSSCTYDSLGTFTFECESKEGEACSAASIVTSTDTFVIVKGDSSFRSFKLDAGNRRPHLSPGHEEAIGQIEFCFKCRNLVSSGRDAASEGNQ